MASPAPNRSGSLWDNPAFLREVALAFHEIASDAGGLTQEKKQQVEGILKANGFDMTWNALRLYFIMVPQATKTTEGGEKVTRGWTDESHQDLLICLLDYVFVEAKGIKPIITDVTARMTARGYTYSYDAINQHVAKLRKARDAKGGAGSAPTTPSKATPKKTPAKRTAGGRSKKSAAPAVKSPEEAIDEEDDVGDFDFQLKNEILDEDIVFTGGDELASTPKRVKVESDVPVDVPIDGET